MSEITTKSKIIADVLSFENGMEHYDHVNRIRLNSKDYKLLIMSDYIPMIGELKGDMIITMGDGTEKLYTNIHGFYRHAHNEFEFILKGKINAQ